MSRKMAEEARGARAASRTALKKLGSDSIFGRPPSDHVDRMKAESDRGAIILTASLIEDTLERRLSVLLTGVGKPSNKELFGLESSLGSFSRKTLFANAMGLITAAQRELVDHDRALRNAAAHFQQSVTFETPEIREAVLLMVSDETRGLAASHDNKAIRHTFVIGSLLLQQLVAEGESDQDVLLDEVAALIEANGTIPVIETLRHWPDAQA